MRHGGAIQIQALTEISIHAPARGATFGAGGYGCTMIISIHAPARGATIIGSGCKTFYGISIHAPARGATTMSLL